MMFLFLMIFFRGVLDLAYVSFVNPVYAYSGFELNFSGLEYFFSWLVYLISIFFSTERIKEVSDYSILTFILFILAPLTSLYGLTSWSITPLLVSFLSFLLFVFLVRLKLIKVPSIPSVVGGEYLAISLSSIMVFFLVVWYFASGASFNLDLAKVYDFRLENAELASVGALAYINNWVYKIFSIFFIAYFLMKKKYFFVALGVVAQIVFFGFSAHKSVLFSLILLFGIWFWFSRTDKAYIIPLGLCGVVLISLGGYFIFDDLMLGSMLVRRVFYIPAYLTYQYFDFFSQNEFVYWSNSVLSGFIEYPYELSISRTIGEYGGGGASANNGFISTGYAHFGYWGVFIYTIIFAFVLRFLDIFSRRVEALWLSLALTIIPLRSALISSDLLTALLTHGLLISIFLLMLMRKSNEKNVN